MWLNEAKMTSVIYGFLIIQFKEMLSRPQTTNVLNSPGQSKSFLQWQDTDLLIFRRSHVLLTVYR